MLHGPQKEIRVHTAGQFNCRTCACLIILCSQILPGVLVSLGMIQRTKWGCVLLRLVINLFKFSQKTREKGLDEKVLFQVVFFFLQLYEMNLGTLLTIKSMRLQLLCVLRVSRVAACQITERPECYGEIQLSVVFIYDTQDLSCKQTANSSGTEAH